MDIFEAFRKDCLETFELDPCWYYSLPGFGWSAMLKKTGVVVAKAQKKSVDQRLTKTLFKAGAK